MDAYEWQLAKDVQRAWREGIKDANAGQKAYEDFKKDAQSRQQKLINMHKG